MKVYVFNGPKRVHGFTEDATGANLPAQHGPWTAFTELDMNRGEPPRIVVNTDEALDDIEKQGYHLVQSQIVSTIKA
jgi:hypothetical protein